MQIPVCIRDTKVNCLLLDNLDGVDRRRFLDDWLRSRTKVCADGALSLLHALSLEFDIDLRTLYPNWLVGDLDSVDEAQLKEYERAGGTVVEMRSQDLTDFEKCVRVYSEAGADGEEWLLVYGAMGGVRLDHTMAALQPLFVYPRLRVKLVQGAAHAFVIPEGDHELKLDAQLVKSKCGLFPMAGPVRVSTDGLKWNLSDTVLKYGELISVCNEPSASQVIIKSDHPILFTIQPRNQL